MAEIKSTLDLIMEKTKNLTLSDEERASLRVGEWTGMVRGWIQKYIDNLMELTDIRNELAAVRKEDRERIGAILTDAILSRIDPDDVTERFSLMVEEFASTARGKIDGAVRAYHDRLERERAGKRDALTASLAAAGVAGSAVIPNVEADPEWKTFREGMKKDFAAALSLRKGA